MDLNALADELLESIMYSGDGEYFTMVDRTEVHISYEVELSEGKQEETTGYRPIKIMWIYIEFATAFYRDSEEDLTDALQKELDHKIRNGYEF